MNALLETQAHDTETLDHRPADGEIVQEADGSPPHQGRSGLRWLPVTERTADPQCDDLVLMHWKKVWRSMVED
jgi:hypothetical protein